MTPAEANEEAKRMFAAFGSTKPSEVLFEFARVILLAGCETCARETVAEIRDSGAKSPTSTMALRTSITERMESPAHMPHLSETSRESAAGKAEGFWHHAATIIAGRMGCSKLQAERVAARMWFSGAVGEDEESVAVECEDAPIWAFEASQPATETLVAHFWAVARRNAVTPITHWPDAEFEASSARETRLLGEASG